MHSGKASGEHTEQPKALPWTVNADIASRVERMLKVFGALDGLHADMEDLHKKQVSAIKKINEETILTDTKAPTDALLRYFQDSRESSEKALVYFFTDRSREEFSGLAGDDLHFAYRRLLSQIRVRETASNREFSEKLIEAAARRVDDFEIRTALTFSFGFDSRQIVPRAESVIIPVPPRPDQMVKGKPAWNPGAGGI